jgi:hypothetical protein
MPVDSIVIKLVRNGVGISSSYNIITYGHGTVVYNGIDNVGVKGRKEESIDNDKIISLLSKFKDSWFFSYCTIESISY